MHKPSKTDLLSYPLLRFFLSNKYFLNSVRVLSLGLMLYAIYFGFIQQENNLFTKSVFWGLFWPFFMLVSLAFFGRAFCGVCPKAFLGKYLNKHGLKKPLPSFLAKRYVGITLLAGAYWGVNYSFPGFFKQPLHTAVLFASFFLLSCFFFYRYKQMSYCKHICPVGVFTRVIAKIAPLRLTTYEQACQSCKTFECAKACTYKEQPFLFAKKGSMQDCTLCMDCSSACENVALKLTPPAFSLIKPAKKPLLAEVWALFSIIAAISMSMGFHHSLGRSAIKESFFWVQSARWAEAKLAWNIDFVGLFAYSYSFLITFVLGVGGIFMAAKVLNQPFKESFSNLGLAYVPVFIGGSLGHVLAFFFFSYYPSIMNGFNQGFSLGLAPSTPLATFASDKWLHAFGMLSYLGYLLSLILLYLKIKAFNVSPKQKILAYFFSASLVLFFIALGLFKTYVFATYGMATHQH